MNTEQELSALWDARSNPDKPNLLRAAGVPEPYVPACSDARWHFIPAEFKPRLAQFLTAKGTP